MFDLEKWGKAWQSLIKDSPPWLRFGTILIAVLQSILLVLAFQTDGTDRTLIIAGVLVCLVLMVIGFLVGAVMRTPHATAQPDEAQSPPERTIDYDVFVSAPMAAYSDNEAIERQREDFNQIRAALRRRCKFERCFYAGVDMRNSEEFEKPHLALRSNIQKLRASRYFIMLYPERMASSILVEAGMAIALGIPSIWFVRDAEDLPFLLRNASQAESAAANIPKVRIYKGESASEIVHALETHGADLFT